MTDWLKKRLQTAKRVVLRWIELAEALEEYWESLFDSEARRLFNMRSIYTAGDEDLSRIISGLGDYFSPYIGADENKPIQIAWRRIELQGKDTESLLQSALRRKFLGLGINWMPLYHEKSADYGTVFKTLEDIEFQGLTKSDFFLTSRGKIRLDPETLDQQNLTFAEFLSAIEAELEQLLPTHIIYMGTNTINAQLELDLYFGGLVVEGVKTTVNMEPVIVSLPRLVDRDGLLLKDSDGNYLNSGLK